MMLKYLFHLVCLVLLIEPLQAAPAILALPGCKDTCGNGVAVPYPFGIGSPNCFIHEWYEVICIEDRPYLSKYYGNEFGGEVLDVSFQRQTITINASNSNISFCGDTSITLGANFSESPFTLKDFKVTIVGCGEFMLNTKQSKFLGGCVSACDQYRKADGCYGINCCHFQKLSSNIKDLYLNVSHFVPINNSCASVILSYYDSFRGSPDGVLAPIKLGWSIPDWMLTADLKSNPRCNGVSSINCDCPYCIQGNPYVTNACQGRYDIDNCRLTSTRKQLALLVVFGTSMGILVLATVGLWLYKTIRRRRKKKIQKKFFKRNGGILLEQQLSVDENIVDKVKLFTASELGKATDFFNQNRVLGHGGQGTVYKGMLVDGRIVAVKKSILIDENQVEQFINEIVVLTQINHRNVVKLLGCCLETDVPLLVYEFIPNGTLHNLIHNQIDEFIMSWDMRVRIAREVAGALTHLHSATSFPIYHRDIKSSNILLDGSYMAKVSDFGTSRNIKIDQTHLTTIVKGTFGYLDPEYFQSSQFTEKSDVYSFGVVLVELLTRQKPISLSATEESSLSLATRFLISMERDCVDMILDTYVLETASYEQVTVVAKLSERCLSLDGKKRPTMKEVAMELEGINISNRPVQQDSSTGISSMAILDNSTFSWTTADDTITSSSDTNPLLSCTF